MSNKLKDWSTTAADNNATPPEGWPEGMAPSKVNDTARQNMKYLREWYEDSQWIRYDHTISASTSTTVTISGDVTDVYVEDRAVRFDQDSARVGFVASATYSAPDTTVTISGYTVSSPTIIEAAAVKDERCLPRDVVGDKARSLIGYPKGYTEGLLMSRAADTDHDITLSAGYARSDGDEANINLSSAITKQLDAVWAEGDNAGGLPAAVTLAGPERLYFFAIVDDDGNVDAGWDSSDTAANLLSASGYSYYKLIGVCYTDASDNLLGPVNKALIGRGIDHIKFTSSYSLELPSWIGTVSTAVIVGAGGGGCGDDPGEDGTAGGDTSFDGVTAGGGGGAVGATSFGTGGAGGAPDTSSLTIFNHRFLASFLSGQAGFAGTGAYGGENGLIAQAGIGYPLFTGSAVNTSATDGGGAGGRFSASSGGGGGAAVVLRNYPVSGTVTITIGAGGSTYGSAATGGDGYVQVEF